MISIIERSLDEIILSKLMFNVFLCAVRTDARTAREGLKMMEKGLRHIEEFNKFVNDTKLGKDLNKKKVRDESRKRKHR